MRNEECRSKLYSLHEGVHKSVLPTFPITRFLRLAVLYCTAIAYYLQQKVLLFRVFTFIPEKLSWLPAFTSFNSIHVQKMCQKLSQLLQKTWNFYHIISNIRYVIYGLRYSIDLIIRCKNVTLLLCCHRT